MPLQTAAGLVLGVLTAALYVYVGRLMLGRETRGPARRALQMFATWWFSLAAITALGSLELGLLAVGVDALEIHTTLTLWGLLPLCVALWGLLYYLLYLHTGRAGILAPLTVFYALVYAYFLYLVVWLDPVGVELSRMEVHVRYARELTGPAVGSVLVLMLGPVALAAMLYGSLLFRLRERVHRFRVALVSGSFFLWFGLLPVVGLATGLNAQPWWPVLSRATGLLVPVLVVLAYRPPARVRRWLEADAHPTTST